MAGKSGKSRSAGARARNSGVNGMPGVAGYLKGRGSEDLTLGPVGAGLELTDRVTELGSRIQALLSEVAVVDDALVAVRDALDVSQPPMWNRVVLRWWRMSGRRKPVLGRTRMEGGRLVVEVIRRLGAIKLRKDRGFALNADLVAKAVRLFWVLERRRVVLVGMLSKAERALAMARAERLEAGRADVGRWRDEAMELRREAVRRLRMVGFEVGNDDEAEVEAVIDAMAKGPEGDLPE